MGEDFKLSIEYEKDGTIPVIYLEGEITSEADEDISSAYSSIPSELKKKVVIEFSKTMYINSAGIATLIGLITKASEAQVKIEFSGLNSHFKKVMDIVGLADFVVIHDSLEQALEN